MEDYPIMPQIVSIIKQLYLNLKFGANYVDNGQYNHVTTVSDELVKMIKLAEQLYRKEVDNYMEICDYHKKNSDLMKSLKQYEKELDKIRKEAKL